MDVNLGFLRRWFDALYVRRVITKNCPLTVVHPERLPKEGPVIFVANHSSLVDAVVIQFCYPPSMLSRIRPSGARDFFRPKRRIDWFKPGKLLKYFMATYFMRLCYLERGSGEAAKRGEVDPFTSFVEPLNRGEMLIYFPQGSRDELLFQKGVYHLAERFPRIPIIPMFLEGTRELHPKGVPFWKFFPTPVTVYVGEQYHFNEALSPAENVRALQIYVYNLVTAR